MFRDSLPTGADAISLVRVLHDHDDAFVMTLLRAVRAALPPGGTVLVAEPLAGTPGAERMGDAYFGFYLLAMGQGRPRSAETLSGMLTQAGFSNVRTHRTSTPLITGLLSGVNLA
jgi:demethylspheroidene O-methyltransferase